MIGYDASGVVVAVGKEVKSLKVGDEVYTRLPEANRGKIVRHNSDTLVSY
jgi:NADPH:quinone reductase-like Zn-dependent oxidoreductase